MPAVDADETIKTVRRCQPKMNHSKWFLIDSIMKTRSPTMKMLESGDELLRADERTSLHGNILCKLRWKNFDNCVVLHLL